MALAWSPAQTRLAYLRVPGDRDGSRGAVLESRNLDGSDPVPILEDKALTLRAVPSRLCWGPDGRLIFPLTDSPPKEEGANLWSLWVDPRTGRPEGRPRRITDFAGFHVRDPSLDASGKRLVFTKALYQVDVYVGELAEPAKPLRDVRRLTRDARDDRPSAWAADGKSVFFYSARSGIYDVYRQDLDSRTAELVAGGPDIEAYPVLDADGTSILFWQTSRAALESPQTSRLMRLASAGALPQRILETDSPALYPGIGDPPPYEASVRCAARAKECLLAEDQNGRLVISLLDPVAGEGKRILELPVGHVDLNYRPWDLSPDGTKIAYLAGQDTLRVVSLDGIALVETKIGKWSNLQSLAWSADGLTVHVTAVGIMLNVSMEGKASTLVVSHPAWVAYPTPSSDGRWLAFGVMAVEKDVWMIEDF